VIKEPHSIVRPEGGEGESLSLSDPLRYYPHNNPAVAFSNCVAVVCGSILLAAVWGLKDTVF